MRADVTLDLHLSNFTYPDVTADRAFETIVEIATTAERSGFSSLSLMDHLHQIPGVGKPSNWMFEGSTMLAAIAARTERIGLGLMVGGVAYRNPALAAKITTTLDVISGGRAWHGVGAGWYAEEHRAYGFDDPPLKTRFEMLEEHVKIARSMFTEPTTTFTGVHFRADGAFNNPKPLRGDIPLLIGGSGERKTLRLVARYADICNVFGQPDRARHLFEVLERHCADVGRDPAQITKTVMSPVLIGADHASAQRKVQAAVERGMRPERLAGITAGDPDTVAERAQAYADAGADGMAISLPDVHDLETLELAGRALSSVFGPAPV